METLHQRWAGRAVPYKKKENVLAAKDICAEGRVANVTGQLMPGKYG